MSYWLHVAQQGWHKELDISTFLHCDFSQQDCVHIYSLPKRLLLPTLKTIWCLKTKTLVCPMFVVLSGYSRFRWNSPGWSRGWKFDRQLGRICTNPFGIVNFIIFTKLDLNFSTYFFAKLWVFSPHFWQWQSKLPSYLYAVAPLPCWESGEGSKQAYFPT